MVSEHQLGCQNLGEKCQNLGEKKIWPKILFRQDTVRSLDFSLDVISLLVSQFDLQNKKYCISLHLVVNTSRSLSRSLHPRVVYSSRAVYSSTSLSDPSALTKQSQDTSVQAIQVVRKG